VLSYRLDVIALPPADIIQASVRKMAS